MDDQTSNVRESLSFCNEFADFFVQELIHESKMRRIFSNHAGDGDSPQPRTSANLSALGHGRAEKIRRRTLIAGPVNAHHVIRVRGATQYRRVFVGREVIDI